MATVVIPPARKPWDTLHDLLDKPLPVGLAQTDPRVDYSALGLVSRAPLAGGPNDCVALMRNLLRDAKAGEKPSAADESNGSNAAASESTASAPPAKPTIPLRPSTFPLPALPPTLRDWVEGISRQSDCAPETAALLALAASAAAIEGRASVCVHRKWVEPLALYVGLVAQPGDRSDSVLEAAQEPLLHLEGEEFYQHEFAEEGAPPPPRRRLDELTARALHHHLARKPRIACFSSQGEVFRQLAGRNSPSRERLVRLLEACHDGADFIAELPRGKEQWVERPHVTIASLIDQSTIAAIAAQRTCPARSLLSRFLLAAPDNRAASLRTLWVMSQETDDAYHNGIRRLARECYGQLQFEPAAMELLQEWLGAVDTEMNEGQLAPITLWAKQLGSTTVRIAGLLHCWVSNEKVISRDTLTAAIAIASWLAPESEGVLAELGAANDDCSQREQAVLRFAREASEFSVRDAWQRLRKSFARPGNLHAALRSLVASGYLDSKGKRFSLVADRPIPRDLPGEDECAESTPRATGDPAAGEEPALKSVA